MRSKKPARVESLQLPVLEINRVTASSVPALTRFFDALRHDPVAADFHPHPLTSEYATHLGGYTGADLYYVVRLNDKVVGYGMLRGWDEGYAVPSLGLALHSDWRRHGLAKLFIQFLHAAARLRGAQKVRLKVYPRNMAAVTLYTKLGYSFSAHESGQLIAFYNLNELDDAR
jgi:ribosomal protein S18 acetylase RimI-like enzyme